MPSTAMPDTSIEAADGLCRADRHAPGFAEVQRAREIRPRIRDSSGGRTDRSVPRICNNHVLTGLQALHAIFTDVVGSRDGYRGDGLL